MTTGAFVAALITRPGDGIAFVSGLSDRSIGTGGFDAALATDVHVAIIQSVPEPATGIILLFGAVVVVTTRR
jgi:hypothetical protein